MKYLSLIPLNSIESLVPSLWLIFCSLFLEKFFFNIKTKNHA
jgi:hypothetical protein